MSWLIRWLRSWFRRAVRLPQLRVVMYTRNGCHLCEEAWALLVKKRHRYQFQLDFIDVDSDPEFAKLFGEHVPVVTVNGKTRFRGVINPKLLQRLLEVEAEQKR
jgi:glutaredoxin